MLLGYFKIYWIFFLPLQDFNYPENVAYPVGGQGNPEFIVLEMHYDNQQVVAGDMYSLFFWGMEEKVPGFHSLHELNHNSSSNKGSIYDQYKYHSKSIWCSYLDRTFWLYVEKFVAGGSVVVVIPPLISDVRKMLQLNWLTMKKSFAPSTLWAV